MPEPRFDAGANRAVALLLASTLLPSILLSVEPIRLLGVVWNLPGSPLSWQPFAAAAAAIGAWLRRADFVDVSRRLAARFPDPRCRERAGSLAWVLAAVLGVAASTMGRMPSMAYLSLVALIAALVAAWNGPFVARRAVPFLLLAALGTPVPPTVLRPTTELAARGTATAVASLLEATGTRALRSDATLVLPATDRTVPFRNGLTGLHALTAAMAGALLIGFLMRVSSARQALMLVFAPLMGWLVHIAIVAGLCLWAARDASVVPTALHADWAATGASMCMLAILMRPRRASTSWAASAPGDLR